MKPITKQEIQAIIDSGVTKNFIEKKLGMGQGSIGKFLTGKLNSLPDKYAAGIRKMSKSRLEDLEFGKNLIAKEMKSLENFPKDLKAAENIDMRPINEDIYKKVEPIDTVGDIMNEIKVPEESIIPEVKFLDERDNPLINAARGRDECGINLDEVQIKRPKINKDLLP